VKTGILGSGFGLYGYLPAVLSTGRSGVVLPERYRAKLLARADVSRFDPQIEWAADENAVLELSDALIISQRPQDQVPRALAASAVPRLKRLLLEKPLAPTPKQAAHLLSSLRAAGQRVRLGFGFRYLPWASELAAQVSGDERAEPVKLKWHFRAHHYRTGINGWKSSHAAGGGALRFYGIHLVALLAELGYSGVTSGHLLGSDADDAARWQAQFTGTGLRLFDVDVNTNASEAGFSVTLGDESLTALSEPFGELADAGGLDRRVSVLASLCADLFDAGDDSPAWHAGSVTLWERAESVTEWKPQAA
jgi:predicted dehydrogenase